MNSEGLWKGIEKAQHMIKEMFLALFVNKENMLINPH